MRDPRNPYPREFAGNVPVSANYFNGQNVTSPIQFRRITNAGADRVEQGNNLFWVPVRISLAPVGT